MKSGYGSSKWVFTILFVILLVVVLAYPQRALFVLKVIWDLIVLNVGPVLENLYHHFFKQ
jgi:cobalamin biosynthesis protein CobD/CbiB